MGKPMGNGYPIAGLASRPEYFEHFCIDVGYFNTFGGNPVAAAAGHAVLDVIKQEQLQTNAVNMGTYLQRELLSLADKTHCVADIRCKGLFIGIEISKNKLINKPDPETASSVNDLMRQQGVLIGAAGKFGNVLKIRPLLCIKQAEADFLSTSLIPC